MKIYKTKQELVVENETQILSCGNENWDDFINDEKSF